MRKLLLPLFLLIVTCGFSQVTESYKDLRDFAKKQPVFKSDSALFLSVYHNRELHYLAGYYKAFQQEEQLLRSMGAAAFYDELTQVIAFAGDYSSLLSLEKKGYDPLPDSLDEQKKEYTDLAKKSFYTDARTYILGRTKTSKVVMINEAHNKPLHRAFTASLLEDLYKQGFRYLAMEALANYRNASPKKVSMLTGHYTCEPVAAELVRKAIEIGFTLFPYEDVSFQKTANRREYAQAQNIYSILKKDTAARIIVYAGYSHIEEGATSDSTIPMAAYFKIISGIDPLTIDQTQMTENSINGYGAWMYDVWMQAHPSATSVVPLINEKPVDPSGFNLYDIHVIHPPTKYLNNRPTWMTLNGWKKEIPVEPAYKSLFMVQAYYENEYNEKTFNQSVPADQTYNDAPNGYYYLYLHKGKYKLVFRDKEYTVLGTKDIVVNE